MAPLNWPLLGADPERLAEIAVTLPAGSPAGQGIARHAGAEVIFLLLGARGLDVRPPAVGTGRRVSLGSAQGLDDHGIREIFEFSALPFSIASTLRTLGRGFPTFYLGWPDADLPEDDQLLRPEELLAEDMEKVVLAVVFQDEVATAPWSWLEALGAASRESGEDQAADAWEEALASLYGDNRSLRVVDAGGHPAANQRFRFQAPRTDDPTLTGSWTLTTGADGDLEAALREADPTTVDNAPSSLFTRGARLVWLGDDSSESDLLPVQSLLESSWADPEGLLGEPSDAPDPEGRSGLLLPTDRSRVHLQVLALDRWLAARPSSSTHSRFHRHSRVEPLVDGLAFYRRLLEDLRLVEDNGGVGVHLAGWTFHEFPLDGIPGSDQTLSKVLDRLHGQGRESRVLINELVNLNEDAEQLVGALLAIILLTELFLDGPVVGTGWPAAWNLHLWSPSVLLAAIPIVSLLFDPLDWVQDSLNSSEVRELLHDIDSSIPVRSPHPYHLHDNPVRSNFDLVDDLRLDDFYDQVGTWHMKVQVLRQPAPLHLTAYLGGMDINPNRLDTPGHHRRAFADHHEVGPWDVAPYHDIQARITGPAASDAARLLEERLRFEQEQNPDVADPVFSTPEASSLTPQASRHLVQIGHTAYRKDPAGQSIPLDYAPDGERTIYNTLVQAIRQARRYIYIEDQYFTPNDRPASGDGADAEDVYFDVLLEAADHCDRLVVLVPFLTDQPFGHTRRTFLFRRLREAWGDRVQIGAPLRRPVLGDPGTVASLGRVRLAGNVSAEDQIVSVLPQARLPRSGPFWLWINGELMLCRNVLSSDIPEAGRVDLEVLRTSNAVDPSDRLLRLASRPRRHAAGSPVTLSQLTGITVHSKVMMVDDLFVSIGSANLNRRGFFVDGEANVFAVPERLQGATDNPARDLRTRLWAEHLGLPPAMGSILLRDPLAAFELFARSPWSGNRFNDIGELVSGDSVFDNIGLGDGLGGLLLQASLLTTLNIEPGMFQELWNLYSDPTSSLDPAPHTGPVPD